MSKQNILKRSNGMAISIESISFILAFAISMIAYLNGIVAVSTDCISRTYFAYAWSINPTLQQTSLWLPFHSVFYGSLFKTLPLSEIAITHFFNALSSAATVWIGLKIVKLFDVHKNILYLATIFLLLSSMRLWLSFSMLSEPPFTLFFLVFVYCGLRYLYQDHTPSFYLSVVFACMISGYRFIAWPVITVYAVLILYKQRNIKHFFAIILMHSFQFFWLFLVYKAYGNPFTGFNLHAQDSSNFYQSTQQPMLFLIKSYGLFFCFAVLFSGLGLIKFKHLKKTSQHFLIFSLAITCVQSLIILRHMPTVLPERAIYLSGLCLTLSACLIMHDLMFSKTSKVIITNHWVKYWGIGIILCFILNLVALNNISLDINSSPQAQLAKALRAIPGWYGNKNWYVGHDFDYLDGMTVLLFSKMPQRFVQVKYDTNTKQLHSQSQKQPIVFFMLNNKRTAQHIQTTWTDSFIIEHYGSYIVSSNPHIKNYFQTLN